MRRRGKQAACVEHKRVVVISIVHCYAGILIEVFTLTPGVLVCVCVWEAVCVCVAH